MMIYESRMHMVITLLVIIIPFLFLLLFARFTQIAATKLFYDVAVSVGRLLLAYLLAAVIGWLCAVAFYRGRGALIALPIFDVLQSFPTFAALPLVTYLYGTSNTTVIFFLVLTVIWPIFFSIISSLKLIRRDWEEAAEVAGLRGTDYLRYFLWPVSVPGLITGSIIGLGEGWEAMVATEIIVDLKPGLGDFFQKFSHNTAVTSFGILGFLILIFSINKLVWIPLLEWSHRTMGE